MKIFARKKRAPSPVCFGSPRMPTTIERIHEAHSRNLAHCGRRQTPWSEWLVTLDLVSATHNFPAIRQAQHV